MGDSMKCSTPPAETTHPFGGPTKQQPLSPGTTTDTEMEDTSIDVETTTPPKSASPPANAEHADNAKMSDRLSGGPAPPAVESGLGSPAARHHLMKQLSMVAALTSQKATLQQAVSSSNSPLGLRNSLLGDGLSQVKKEVIGEGEDSNPAHSVSSNEENVSANVVAAATPVSVGAVKTEAVSSTSSSTSGSKSVQNNNTSGYSEGFSGGGRLKFFKGKTIEMMTALAG